MKHSIEEIRNLDDSTFVLRLTRNSLSFKPGQYVTVGIPGQREKREYTIFSSPDKDYLELLIKEVSGGDVSGQLHRLTPGSELDLEGPFGEFTLPENRRESKLLFIATGTGIAPFHSFACSYPDLNYIVLHGVSDQNQQYGKESFHPDRYIGCLTQSDQGEFKGRVTEYLKQASLESDTLCYLCGNSDMIYEAFQILTAKGIPRQQQFTEVYF